jgi:hypothetical protein
VFSCREVNRIESICPCVIGGYLLDSVGNERGEGTCGAQSAAHDNVGSEKHQAETYAGKIRVPVWLRMFHDPNNGTFIFGCSTLNILLKTIPNIEHPISNFE